MTDGDVSRIREELLRQYPGAHIKVTPDRAEMVAEIEPGRAVAVIERSVPHFHERMTETYRGLKGTLYVSSGGRGHVLKPGEELTIEPGNVHYARGDGEPAWIEVLSKPDWTPDDHLVLADAAGVPVRPDLIKRITMLLDQIGNSTEGPQPLPPPVQDSLGRLSTVLPYLPRLKNAEINVAQAELAVRALLSHNPENNLATAIVDDLVRRKGVYDSAYRSIVYGRTPVTFVLLGIAIHALLLAAGVYVLSLIYPCAATGESVCWQAMAIAGAVGGATSLLSRLNQLAGLSRWSSDGDPRQLFYTGLLKPAVGIVGGLFAYAVFSTGLVKVDVPGAPGSAVLFYAALAFLAGFSERFAKDLADSASEFGGAP